MKKTLHNIKNTGFNTPKDYFNSFEEDILYQLKFKKIPAKSGYTVPENYFDSLEDNIIKAAKQSEEIKVINLFSWRKIAYITGVAASLILMINVFFNKTEQVSIDAIETANIENYILNEDLEAGEFASLFSKEDLSEIHLINDGYNEQNLENYLFENLEIDDIITK